MDYWFDALLLFVLIFLSAVFSGAEIALMSLSKAKVRELREQKLRGSKYLTRLRKDPHRLLITILIGNNLVNIGASVYATVWFTELFGSSGVGIATGVMTFLVLLFGEIAPKTLAHRYRVGFSLFISRPLIICQYVFLPVVVILDWIIHTFSSRGKLAAYQEEISEGEIRAMMDLGVEGGAIDEAESELIENVLEFSDITVESVMTPRVKIDALEEGTTLKEAAQFIVEHTHSRIPVYKENIDNVIGFISVRDILHHVHEGKGLDKKLGALPLSQTVNVPYTYKINRLFQQFQRKGVHLAMVRDEFGGVMGLVTLEDLLEEIVGEIIDESDREDNLILAKGEDWVKIRGDVPVEVISDHFDIDFPGDSHFSISSVILEELHEFPKLNQELDFGDYKVVVTKMADSAIEEVKIVCKK